MAAPAHAATLATLRAQLQSADVAAVVVELDRGDLTPVGAMQALGLDAPCFLLESGEHGSGARWSILGHAPSRTIECNDIEVDPLGVLAREVASRAMAPTSAELPIAGGAVGFLSYECARHYERIPAAADSLHVPDAWFGVYDRVVVFDHQRDVVMLVGCVHADDPGGLEQAHANCIDDLRTMQARLQSGPRETPRSDRGGPSPDSAIESSVNMSDLAFSDAFARCHDYILAGDIFQVQISRRFGLPLRAHPFDVYRALRSINPSPYMFYMATPHGVLVGASPEMLVQVCGRSVRYHPIAGTRRRGRDASDDARMEAELRGSEKEAAEHLMLVDLGRNDIGRVCAAGTVRVSELMEVERYSHVMHLVSTIEGTLRDDATALDALRACFPAGTVTGAPKIRAMEIIAELEPEARGVYAGAVGHVAYGGDLDTAIALRTLLTRDDVAFAQAAAGIVADSTPREEALEIDNKVRALLRAVEVANA